MEYIESSTNRILSNGISNNSCSRHENNSVWLDVSGPHEEEEVAENIDKKIHELQYLVDHTRRLIQGAESHKWSVDEAAFATESGIELNDHNRYSAKTTESSSISAEQKRTMKNRLEDIKSTVAHVREHIDTAGEAFASRGRSSSELSDTPSGAVSVASPPSRSSQKPLLQLDNHVMVEIDHHMAELDEYLSQFHDAITIELSHWKYHGHTIPMTKKGDKIPPGLVTTVAADSFIDGFLIGLTALLSPAAGMILAAANCIEVSLIAGPTIVIYLALFQMVFTLQMSFLGISLSVAVNKCTGSPQSLRTATIVAMPFIIVLGALVGSTVGTAVTGFPALFAGFVAFGVVALTALACQELIPEAKEAEAEDGTPAISIHLFIGILIILMLHRFLE